MMAKWKYKVVTKRIKDIDEAEFNDFGKNDWELVFMTQLWNGKIETAIAAVILWALPSLFGIMGVWQNRDLFREEQV